MSQSIAELDNEVHTVSWLQVQQVLTAAARRGQETPCVHLSRLHLELQRSVAAHLLSHVMV